MLLRTCVILIYPAGFVKRVIGRATVALNPHLCIRKEKHHRFGSRRGGGILWGLKSVLEQRGGQVAVAGIRQQGYDGLACVLRALGQLLGSPNGCTGADTGEHRVGLSQALTGGKASSLVTVMISS